MGKKVEKIKKICPTCGKEYFVRPSENLKYIYCSVECRKVAHRINKKCIECGREYYVYKDKATSMYCSQECKNKHDQNALILKVCPGCGKEFSVRQSEDERYTYCSLRCRMLASNTEYKCDYCGNVFYASNRKIENNKRGVYCSTECSEKSQISGKFVPCENCGKIVYRTKSELQTYSLSFCCNQCKANYDNKQVEKICKYCGKHYVVKNERSNITRFCSIECKNNWQSTEENCGINNPRFNRILTKCSYCGKEFYLKSYKLHDDINHFCCYNCRNEYYKIHENRTDKQLSVDKNLGKNAIKYTKPSLTLPHKKVLDMLDLNGINYQVEYLIEYYKLDVFLTDYNLAIEVQGDFWHCSPIRYENIQYQQQIHSIRRDKSKHTYTKRYYGYEILWLWERDITNNEELCKSLIEQYIKSNGNLDNYNSFNYEMVGNKLSLKEHITKPFQEMSTSEIAQYIHIKNAS